MANENDFLEFGDGVGATVIDQATYLAAAWRLTGFQNGIADPSQLNKVWRQGAAMAAAVATFIVSEISQDVLDNGDIAALAAKLALAIQQTSTIKPSRLWTASTDPVTLLTDYRIGLNRAVAPAATPIALPVGAQPGQSFVYQDLKGNFNQFNATVTPPVGSIAGEPAFIMDRDRGRYEFEYYGSNLWGVSQS